MARLLMSPSLSEAQVYPYLYVAHLQVAGSDSAAVLRHNGPLSSGYSDFSGYEFCLDELARLGLKTRVKFVMTPSA